MLLFARLVNPEYDFHRRMGLKEGTPFPNEDAAERIVQDLINDGFFVDFVEVLIRIDHEGYMGHRYPLHGLNSVAAGLLSEGYSFDKVSGSFLENQRERISVNWGRLIDGDERKMAMLRLDIVGNSQLVKNNPQRKIEKAYDAVRKIVSKSVIDRLGRLWSWEGDGALAAFLFGEIERMAIYAGMEILHEMFFYNRLRNPLNGAINLRLGAHIGTVRYSENESERSKNEIVKKAVAFESIAGSNEICVPYNLYITMDANTLKPFGAEKSGRYGKYRLYSMGLEK
jgi:class 3 adenylate cyclase